MIVKIDKSFEKDTDKINDQKLLLKIVSVIESFDKATTIVSIKNIKRLQGYPNYYRIKIGTYRIGFRLENATVYFERCLHRKDIYKKFP